MDQTITRAAGAAPSTMPPAAAAPRLVGEFQGYVEGEPSVVWADRKNMPQVGDKLYALPPRAAVPRSWSILLTSANHGVVGAAGSEFKAVPEGYERVQVMEIVEAGAAPAPGTDLGGLVRIMIDGTVIPLAAPSALVGASTAPRPTDDDLWDATLRDRDAYHEWADKLADAIAKHFGVDIGEHSNQNLPWDEALQAIENAEPVGASTVLTDERELRKQLGRALGLVDGVNFAASYLIGLVEHQTAFCDEIEKEREVAAQAGQVAVPEGWKLVPLEPTEDMVGCAWMIEPPRMFGEVYRAMLAAAPSAPAVAQQAPARAEPLPADHVRIADLPRIYITLRQAKELLSCFGGHDAEIAIFDRPAEWSSLPQGLYAFFNEDPDAGTTYLGPTEVDDDLAIHGEPAPAHSIDTPGVRALLAELAAWGGAGGMVKVNEFVGRAAAAIRAPAKASTSGERQEGGK